MAAELVKTMTAHLKAEGDLVEAMFVRKDAFLAHDVNLRCAELLERRRDLIHRIKSHIERAHGRGIASTEFALP
jgi:hypothetical protein